MRSVALLGVVAGMPLLGDACSLPLQTVTTPPSHAEAPARASDVQLAYEGVPDVAEDVVSAVVNISSTREVPSSKLPRSPFESDPFFRHFFGPPGMRPDAGPRHQSSLGSGVLVRADGVVLTNSHVVDGATEVEVTLEDGRQFEAEIVGTDPKSDVAVVRLVDPPDDLDVLPLGDSDALRLGETVLAVGNPFGVGQTVTMGIVSAVGRANVGIVDYEDFIQTDAAINPGNSGGALVNLRGELVGINTAIMSRSGGYQGIGFAIPSNMADGISRQLLDDGKVDRGFLGVGIQELEPGISEAMGLEDVEGVLVSDVSEGSAAEKAGLRAGDVVLSFDGHAVRSPARLRNLVAASGSERPFEVEVLRKGKKRVLRGTLGGLPGLEEATDVPVDAGSLGGLTVAPLTPELRDEFDVSSRVRGGVVVTEVQPGSAADRAGLRTGDVLLELGREPIRSPADLERLYGTAPDRVLLFLWRDGSTRFVVLRK